MLVQTVNHTNPDDLVQPKDIIPLDAEKSLPPRPTMNPLGKKNHAERDKCESPEVIYIYTRSEKQKKIMKHYSGRDTSSGLISG
jgi:hypothetical protein